jgi:hypothetical protein
LNGGRVLAIQDDSRGKDRVYYCPGIMLWKKSSYSERLLIDVYKYQRNEIINGQVLPDDKTLNFYLNEKSLYHLVTTLDKTEFIIGHRFPFLMAGKNGFKLRRTVAFHANYAKGSKVKNLYLKEALINSGSPMRLLYLAGFLVWRFISSKI